MPLPKDVFEDPEKHLDFLKSSSDSDFEDQHFDRKEACRADSSGIVSSSKVSGLKDQVIECISAFANENKEGGLLVLGISSEGKIEGVNLLTEKQLNNVTNFNQLLVHHGAKAKLFECEDESGAKNRICLIKVSYADKHICETPGNSPKAWMRQGRQNILVDDQHRERIKREKGIVEFERTNCCAYDASDLDPDVVEQFRVGFLANSDESWGTEEMLRQAGALVRVDGGYSFTNAGLLFFAINPQRVLPAAYVRLLRFGAKTTDPDRGLPTFEKDFKGPVTKQIRNLRNFFKDSGFFKVYQRRAPDGGFIEEPELPYVAVDEALVNAVAHRDYAASIPIECETFTDGLIVKNMGRLQQRDRDLPDQFTLQDFRLDSAPRNPLLIEWMKLMKDEQGTPFVRALSEGTESMRKEMAKLGLPPPVYRLSPMQTQVTLYSDAERREALLRNGGIEEPTEFANLFPIRIESDPPSEAESPRELRRGLMSALKNGLKAKRWYIDSAGFSRIIAHRQGQTLPIPKEVSKSVRFYPAYSFQVRNYKRSLYLCVDYTLEVKNVRTVSLLNGFLNNSDLLNRVATARWHGWELGKIVGFTEEHVRVFLFDYEKEVHVDREKVIPHLPIRIIAKVLAQDGINFNLSAAIKQNSLSAQPNSARVRMEKTWKTVEMLGSSVFPLTVNGTRAFLEPSPVALSRHRTTQDVFSVFSLREPNVEFGEHHAEANIREGITKFGSYGDLPKTIELVPIVTTDFRSPVAKLIERLKAGKYKYKGSERTFHTRFVYNSVIALPSYEEFLPECKRLISEHPEWVGDNGLNRLFLVYSPEERYALDDEESPYYRIKRTLLEAGIPNQMVDTSTIIDPEWKDLNLALNIAAKCGVTPWVLPDAIPDADFFLGLSYTQTSDKDDTRLMGYANVFNSFGKWMFYSGNTFPYSDRVKYLGSLVTRTLNKLTLTDTPSIYFHYSAKFSREDRAAILKAARDVRPHGTYYFIWINTHHNVRLYDVRPETDGSLPRGNYVITSPNQFFLSTTGYNPYRKALGTPQMLEINVWVERPSSYAQSAPDLKSIAVQILNLTKLNWASTDSLCAEPITTKYAHDIAYLTSAFLRQSSPFTLHPTLEQTTWFI